MFLKVNQSQNELHMKNLKLPHVITSFIEHLPGQVICSHSKPNKHINQQKNHKRMSLSNETLFMYMAASYYSHT